MKNAPFTNRLSWAWQGITSAYKQESSFQTQANVGLIVLVFLLVFQPGWIWAAIIILATGLVLVAELINTALEATLDGLHPDQAPFVKLAKDCAAGAALVASMTAAVVAMAFVAELLA
jgi:diacylglycerol kinase (ATP)